VVLKILGAFHIDMEMWENKIEKGDLGKVREEYETWSKEKPFTKETVTFWQYFQWYAWSFLILYALYFFISFYFFKYKFSRALFARYKKKVFRREAAYYAKSCSREIASISG
jgi:hypothetical protein